MGGNPAIAAAGRSHIGIAAQEAWIMSHESAPPRQGLPPEALPTETYSGPYKKLNFFNGEGVVIWHQPSAHTAGDSIVQFRESEVLATGDVFNMAGYPVIDIEKGGRVQGIIAALSSSLDTAALEDTVESE